MGETLQKCNNCCNASSKETFRGEPTARRREAALLFFAASVTLFKVWF